MMRHEQHEEFEFLNIVISNFILEEPSKGKGIISVTSLKKPLDHKEVYKLKEDHIPSDFL